MRVTFLCARERLAGRAAYLLCVFMALEPAEEEDEDEGPPRCVSTHTHTTFRAQLFNRGGKNFLPLFSFSFSFYFSLLYFLFFEKIQKKTQKKNRGENKSDLRRHFLRSICDLSAATKSFICALFALAARCAPELVFGCDRLAALVCICFPSAAFHSALLSAQCSVLSARNRLWSAICDLRFAICHL